MLSDRCPVLTCLAICDVGVFRPNVWADEDETWHASRPRPRPHCVTWGIGDPAHPAQKRAQPPIFGPSPLWPNSWVDQDVTWYGGRPRPRQFVLDGDPAPLPKGGIASHFRPRSVVAKRLDGS